MFTSDIPLKCAHIHILFRYATTLSLFFSSQSLVAFGWNF